MDDNFTRSVILLCEHSDEGSFGFILNNTLDLRLHEFANGFPETEATVGYGGPVDRNQLFFIHRIPELEGSVLIAKELYIGGNYQEMLQLLGEEKIQMSDIRFFIGYTGWGEGQLQNELDEKTWIVATPPASFSAMKTSDDTLWKDILNDLGGKYKLMAEYPLNPADN